MAELIRVLLADDHPLVRTGIRTIISSTSDVCIVGEAANAWEVTQLCDEVQADVLVMDLRMPGPPAVVTIEYAREHCPAMKVLIITAYEGDDDIRLLLASGVSGYVQKCESLEVVLQAIRVVASGGTWFNRTVVRTLMMTSSERTLPIDPVLNEKELAVLQLVAQGHTDKDIARHLAISERTVRDRLRSASTKLNVEKRIQATIEAVRRGLV